MENDSILIKTEDHICIITLNKPSTLNALDNTLIEGLDNILDKVASDESILVVIITGAGRSFIAGADISSMSNMDASEGGKFGLKGANLMRKIENLPKPVIAAVNGYALGGGCELALSCDIRVASEKAKFGQPEVTLGITPGFSGSVRLPSIVGVARAKELIFTGKVIDAQEALNMNLVNKVVSSENLMDEAISIAQIIVKNSPIALKYSKESINMSRDMATEAAIKVENNFFALCFSSDDQKEGMQAFLDKRKPEFLKQKNQ